MPHFVYEEPDAFELVIADPIDRIANIAHSCYQVQPKAHDSNVVFVKNLCSVFHMAMLDHGFIHLRFEKTSFRNLIPNSKESLPLVWNYIKFMNFALDGDYVYLTTSLRTLTNAIDAIYKARMLENSGIWNKDGGEDLNNVVEGFSYEILIAHIINNLPSEMKDIVLTHFKKEDNIEDFMKRILQLVPLAGKNPLFTILTEEDIKKLPESIRDSQQFLVYRLKTDRGVTHELVRHRLCAFAQESTRYCNYSKQKFGDTLHVIKPIDYDKHPSLYDQAFENMSVSYFALLADKARPEEARAVLANNLKAEITITASLQEWKHIFFQRLAPDAHPEARKVVKIVHDDMIKKGYLK